MKILLESTAEIVTLPGGIKARVWQGRTEAGVVIFAKIASIAVGADENQGAFQRELIEQPHAPLSIDLRLIL